MELLVGLSAADAVRGLQAEYGLSERQARRYVIEARARPEGVVVPERTVVVTVRWRRRWSPACASGRGQWGVVERDDGRGGGVRISIGLASGRVARRVEVEFVGDRLADARLAQAMWLGARAAPCDPGGGSDE